MKSTNGKAVVFFKDKKAGILRKDDLGYTFTYDDEYFNGSKSAPISLSLPLTQKEYKSKKLFSFFEGIIPRWRKNAVCSKYGIDESDIFFILLHTGEDTYGATYVIPIEIEKKQ